MQSSLGLRMVRKSMLYDQQKYLKLQLRQFSVIFRGGFFRQCRSLDDPEFWIRPSPATMVLDKIVQKRTQIITL